MRPHPKQASLVAAVTPAKKDLTVTIAKSHQVYLIQYSATTIYYESHLRNIHVGTKVTGSLVGTTMTAQRISSKVVTRTSTATSGIASPNFGASGPCVGRKYVGNVERFFSGTRGVARTTCGAVEVGVRREGWNATSATTRLRVAIEPGESLASGGRA